MKYGEVEKIGCGNRYPGPPEENRCKVILFEKVGLIMKKRETGFYLVPRNSL